ncbi:helix-turn-helix domain-containing protein [uncultured Nocardioides sp.]|uniref:helix-turn-helix domain-containing protein n=1 Tax=uncultured Nocardioides sp. TaxID=198441 RepID=UPI0025D9427E|nr:helix-turn-helix transcriptional regulator [uncultured Nocardioides sp.]
MRDDLIDLLQTIDPALLGERIRAARLRAGLTQAHVAGDAVSVGYVSRIESGQRRPDTRLLTRIADRVSVPVDELLLGVARDRVAELQVALDHAELELATGSPADALARVEQVLADPGTAGLGTLRRSAAHVRARALEAVGDLQRAILALEDLAADAPDLTWIEGMTALSRCYRESGELGRAIEVGIEATRRIEELGLDGLDEAVRLTLGVAAAYYEQGDADYAARLCQRAIDRAEAMDSPVAKAMAYWNSSAIESMRGNAAAALPLTRRALAVIEASHDARSTARLRTQLGILQLLLDPPQPREALEVLTVACRELATTGAGPADMADNRLAQARARLLLGDTDDARRQATEIVDEVRSSMPLLAADAHALLGQVAVHDDELDLARSHFQEAVLLLSGAGADRAAAQLWFELAGMLESVGEPAAALDAYRRAAAATGLVAPPARRTMPARTA